MRFFKIDLLRILETYLEEILSKTRVNQNCTK